MKIEIGNARDGGRIKMDGETVGYIENYRRGPSFIRFVNVDNPEYIAYGTTKAVARIKYGGYAEAKKYAREMLKAAGGDFRKLAELGEASIWGDDAIAYFSLPAAAKRILDRQMYRGNSLEKKVDELKQENRDLVTTVGTLKKVEAPKPAPKTETITMVTEAEPAPNSKPSILPKPGYHWVQSHFGDWFQERKDVPYTCSPRSETYWSS